VNDEPCIFDDPDPGDVLFRNERWYAREDRYPVSDGHILLIPFRHVASFFDLSPDERATFFEIVERARAWIGERYSPGGYNIGVNIGSAAGQAVMHCHVHVIPRYEGDGREDGWKGGMRRTVPAGDYRDHM
jgi:diadenosine tetraphosphate (Ap4A) HIT family hydrolase